MIADKTIGKIDPAFVTQLAKDLIAPPILNFLKAKVAADKRIKYKALHQHNERPSM